MPSPASLISPSFSWVVTAVLVTTLLPRAPHGAPWPASVSGQRRSPLHPGPIRAADQIFSLSYILLSYTVSPFPTPILNWITKDKCKSVPSSCLFKLSKLILNVLPGILRLSVGYGHSHWPRHSQRPGSDRTNPGHPPLRILQEGTGPADPPYTFVSKNPTQS